jgi:hypothetical protein
MEAATDAKTAVEDAQRDMRRKRDESGEKHVPRFFEQRDARWVPKLMYAYQQTYANCTDQSSSVPNDPQEAVTAVQQWIWPPSHLAS